MKQFVLRPRPTSESHKTVHIAVDFGTTFTATAYALDDGSAQAVDTSVIQIISKWPSGTGTAWDAREVRDVPTELLYKDGQKEPVAWGWEARKLVKHSYEPYRLKKHYATRFKLLLSQKENSKNIRQDLEKRILVDGRAAIDPIVHFLEPLRHHILRFIQKAEEEEEEFWKWNMRWTLTVPADWDPFARRQMKEAAQKAGFHGPLKLISEPEAAALYILEKRTEGQKKLTLENAAVVGDLGGGTMVRAPVMWNYPARTATEGFQDCATYQIAGLEPLSLSALAHVQGRILGSGNLNDGFRRHLESRLAESFDDYLVRETNMSRDQILEHAVEWFEFEKRGFRGPDDNLFFAPIPGLHEDEKMRFAPGRLELSIDDLLSIFDPIVDQIIDLLNDQIFKSVHYRMKESITRSKFRVEKVFLTGGLAGNPYVEHRVSTAFENGRIHSYPIPVLTPREPETAVVRGAVWRSLQPEVITKRVSETSYGFRRDESYREPWPHGPPSPVENTLTGAIEVKDRMKWVIKQGESFKNNQRVPYRLERFVPVGGSLEFEESLYYSDTVKDDHVHYEKPDIHFLETLPFNLEKWRKCFDVMQNERGERYMMIEYDLVSVFSEDEWEYEIEVMQFKTKFKGSTNISAAFKLSQGIGHD